MAHIISIDNIKSTLKGYKPDKAEVFHHKSAKLADKQFEKTIKKSHLKTVILMAGGSASGETEYIENYLRNKDVIVFDGTMPSFKGAEIKIKRIVKADKKAEVHLVLPISLLKAFNTFLGRERKFSPRHFYHTHSKSRESVLMVAQKYPQIIIRIFLSAIVVKNFKLVMQFTEQNFKNRDDLIEYLQNKQYNEETIRKQIHQP